MNTEKKLKLMWCVTASVTVVAVVLSVAAMLFEFESDIGYFAHFAPLHTISQILTTLLTLFVLVMTLTMKKHETCQIINYNSSVFRFFASMTACLSLLAAYVEFNTLISSLRESASPVSSTTAVIAGSLFFAVVSFFVYFNYCFGKNEKKSDTRGLCGMMAVGYLLCHLMETHLVWPTQMNNPVKIALQLAIIALMLALTYTFKCEFAINKTSGRLRLAFMLICPVVALVFAIPTVIAYYARIYTSFNTLVDAIYITSACGFVLASYMPQRLARPIAAAEWAEINADANNEESDLADAGSDTEAETEPETETEG